MNSPYSVVTDIETINQPKNYESDLYKSLRIQQNWKMYDIDKSKIYKIIQFDDGNQNLIDYENEWYIYGEWKGKVCICNKLNPNILIFSISLWKLMLI